MKPSFTGGGNPEQRGRPIGPLGAPDQPRSSLVPEPPLPERLSQAGVASGPRRRGPDVPLPGNNLTRAAAIGDGSTPQPGGEPAAHRDGVSHLPDASQDHQAPGRVGRRGAGDTGGPPGPPQPPENPPTELPDPEPPEFTRIRQLGYTIAPTEVPPFEEVVDRINPLIRQAGEVDAGFLLMGGLDVSEADYISVATQALRERGLSEDAITYASRVAMPSLIALHNDHGTYKYKAVDQWMDNFRESDTLPTQETMQEQITQAIDFVERRPEIFAAVDQVFTQWMSEQGARSNIVGVVQVGSYARRDAHFLSDLDTLLVADGEVTGEDYEQFRGYIQERLTQIHPSLELDEFPTGESLPIFQLQHIRRQLRDSAVTPEAIEQGKIFARDDQMRDRIEASFAPPPPTQALPSEPPAAEPEYNFETALEARYGPQKAGLYLEYLRNNFDELHFNVEVLERLLGPGGIDENLVSQLQALSNQAQETPLDPIIPQARDEVRAFFDRSDYGLDGTIADFLRSHGISLMLYGSLQYGDPRNLDVDIMAVSESPTELDQFVAALGEDFRRYWQGLSPFRGQRRGEPNMNITDHVSSFEDITALLARDPEGLELLAPPQIITGIPLFAQDQPVIQRLKQQMRGLVEADPLLAATTNTILNGALQERLQRRQERNP